MQKLRDPNTFKGAVAKIVAALGREWCASAVDRKERQVYNWTDPDSDQLPNLAQAFELDRIYQDAGKGEGPIGRVWSDKKARVNAPPHEPECPNKRTTDLLRELGEAVAEEAELPDEGDISPNQCMSACRQWDDVIRLAEAKKRDLRARVPQPLQGVPA